MHSLGGSTYTHLHYSERLQPLKLRQFTARVEFEVLNRRVPQVLGR